MFQNILAVLFLLKLVKRSKIYVPIRQVNKHTLFDRDGFEYRSCDCPRNCVPGRNMTEVEMTCSSCKLSLFLFLSDRLLSIQRRMCLS